MSLEAEVKVELLLENPSSMRLFKVFKRKQPYKFQVQYRYSSNLWYNLYRGATKSFGKINQIILTVSLKDRWGGEQFSLNP